MLVPVLRMSAVMLVPLLRRSAQHESSLCDSCHPAQATLSTLAAAFRSLYDRGHVVHNSIGARARTHGPMMVRLTVSIYDEQVRSGYGLHIHDRNNGRQSRVRALVYDRVPHYWELTCAEQLQPQHCYPNRYRSRWHQSKYSYRFYSKAQYVEAPQCHPC